eukprot:scaffold192482_cov14-Tisochrysis_lutea.AAC.1
MMELQRRHAKGKGGTNDLSCQGNCKTPNDADLNGQSNRGTASKVDLFVRAIVEQQARSIWVVRDIAGQQLQRWHVRGNCGTRLIWKYQSRPSIRVYNKSVTEQGLDKCSQHHVENAEAVERAQLKMKKMGTIEIAAMGMVGNEDNHGDKAWA